LFGGLEGEVKAKQIEKLRTKLTYVNDNMLNGGKKYLVGDKLSVSDLYLYIVVGWSKYFGIEVSDWKAVHEFWQRVDQLPKVVEAHAAMATQPTKI
jgi:glutathione S-transferase